MADMPNDVYGKYSIRNEFSLFVTYSERTSNLSIGYETWQLCFSGSLLTIMHSSGSRKTVAELVFWYWKDKKEIVILQKSVHAFEAGTSSVSVTAPGITPANSKFNVLIRLLDERIATDNNSLESYYCHNEGLETITLSVAGAETDEETLFVVPKYVLMFASPVFRRMFAIEMTEKTPGKVDIQNTNSEDFGDFLKAISPKQENPNPSNVLALLKLADCYDCQSLRKRCETHLMNCVEISLVELLNSVKLYGLDDLKAKLMESFRENGLLGFVQQYKPMHDLVNELATMIE